MTSRQRVRDSLAHIKPDRVPANFESVPFIKNELCKRYGFSDIEQLYQEYEIDVREIAPVYIGNDLKCWQEGSDSYTNLPYGCTTLRYNCGKGEYKEIVAVHPFDRFTSIKEIENFKWINPDMYDYVSIKRGCDRHRDNAIIFGHEGIFSLATYMMDVGDLLPIMAFNPQVAHALFDRIYDIESEYYERALLAGEGRIDIMCLHDDFASQFGMLFSADMWQEYFASSVRKLSALAHKYGAFYQQHCSGAIDTILPMLIECGVDSVEPITKTSGMKIDTLKRKYGDKLSFHGGIDTSRLLPFGTIQEVKAETEHFIKVGGDNGGYILMGSQIFDRGIPLANIEQVYRTKRN